MFLYSIYATALSGIVLIILVVPMGIDFSRRYSPLKSSVASFALALAFWGTLSASESFGYSGILPPLVASSLLHLFFLGIGAVLLIVKEKAR